jgi:two-component system, chemotaxis family, protein-glutamate methylesterase/glutaminase
MARRPDASRVVALGASAGGLPALEQIITALGADLPAAVLVVMHLDPRHASVLPALLARRAKMQVKHAAAGESIEPGVVYVATPNFHLEASGRHIGLGSSALVHFTRPSVDRLFESVALVYADSTIAVVLTGSGVDGAQGIVAIRRGGGTTIAQDPAEATYPAMPLAAIATGCVDLVLPLVEIAPAITRLCASGRVPRTGN